MSELATLRASVHATARTAPEPRHPVLRLQDVPAPVPGGRRLEDRQFEVMKQEFNASGGLVDGNTLAWQLRRRLDQPVSKLARAIVAREVVCLVWRSQWMLPMFQFEGDSLAVHGAVTQVIAELSEALDDWDLALWFAQPNPWLADRAPARLIVSDAKAVHEAARADRYVARA